MSVISGAFMIAGSLVAVLAGIGVLRFSTSYARFHAAGKASPIAFLVAAIGTGIELGADGASYLIIGGIAMVLTLPIGVHLLFRAVHRTTDGDHLVVDELAQAEATELQ